jgi:superoxide dismutase, Fe-Mn family
MNPISSFCSSLPYDFGAFEPILSGESVQYHFIQHHRRCYERTAALVKGSRLQSLSLPSLLRVTGARPECKYLFMMAAEAWNHDLYWSSLRPGGGGAAWGPIGADIERCFGSFRTFLREANSRAAAVVGSGWLWVTWRAGRIEIVTTGKGDSPILHGHIPLLALDLWEHAYYLDYYSAREAYVSGCVTRLFDWGHANERLMEAKRGPLNAREALAWLAGGAPKTLPEMRNSSREILSPEQRRQLSGIHASR